MSEQHQRLFFLFLRFKAMGTKRIVHRIIDVFALLICIVILLNIGFKLSEWWRVDDPTATSHLIIQPTSKLTHSEFQAQSNDAIQNLSNDLFSGSAKNATQELVERCQSLLSESKSIVFHTEISSVEQRLLKGLNSLEPLLAARKKWKIYSIPGRWPSVIGIINCHESTNTLSNSWRVLFWSMAIPFNHQMWRLWMIERQLEIDMLANTKSEFDLPPDTIQLISLDSGQENQFTSFSGVGPINKWISFFNQHYLGLKWDQVNDWKQIDGRFFARFSSGVNKSPLTTVDIILYQTGKNEFKGIRIHTQK